MLAAAGAGPVVTAAYDEGEEEEEQEEHEYNPWQEGGGYIYGPGGFYEPGYGAGYAYGRSGLYGFGYVPGYTPEGPLVRPGPEYGPYREPYMAMEMRERLGRRNGRSMRATGRWRSSPGRPEARGPVRIPRRVAGGGNADAGGSAQLDGWAGGGAAIGEARLAGGQGRVAAQRRGYQVNNQVIYSAMQFMKLITATKPGETVK